MAFQNHFQERRRVPRGGRCPWVCAVRGGGRVRQHPGSGFSRAPHLPRARGLLGSPRGRSQQRGGRSPPEDQRALGGVAGWPRGWAAPGAPLGPKLGRPVAQAAVGARSEAGALGYAGLQPKRPGTGGLGRCRCPGVRAAACEVCPRLGLREAGSGIPSHCGPQSPAPRGAAGKGHAGGSGLISSTRPRPPLLGNLDETHFQCGGRRKRWAFF